MKRLQYANRDQIVLYPQTIADSLKSNHEIFAFVQLIDKIDVTKFLRHYSREGGRAYDPRLMLGILIYGYHRGWRSSRELQRACEENMAMRYLVGDQKVKFRAIAEFRVKFADEISDVMKQSVAQVLEVCSRVGEDTKVDSTKIKANAANDQTYTKRELEARKKALEKKIMDYLNGGIDDDKRDDARFGDADGYEIDQAEVELKISEFIATQKKQARERLQKLKKPECQSKPAKPVDPNQQEIFTQALQLEKIKNVLEQNKNKPDDEKINLTDPDALFMKNRGKIVQSYNVQITSSEGFIVAADIAKNNAPNDLEQLPAILAQAQENLGKPIKRTTEDSGYFHAVSLEYLAKNNIEGFIPSPQQVSKERKELPDTGYEPHHFQYNAETNSLTCPQGKPLEFHRTYERDGQSYSMFHGKPIHCVMCVARKACCRSKEDDRRGYRSVELGQAHVLKHAMILKMQTESAKQIYRKRGAEIEPIFGNWKALKNFWYFLLRGTEKVRIEVKLMAIAFNFGKLARLQAA